MPDEADGTLRRDRADEPVEVCDVIDEVVEAAGARPGRISVPSLVVGDGTARQKRRERVE